MDFQEYEKDGVIITATETAYEVIYKTQGFRPVEEKPPEPVKEEKKPPKGGKKDGKAGGSTDNHGEGAPTGEPSAE